MQCSMCLKEIKDKNKKKVLVSSMGDIVCSQKCKKFADSEIEKIMKMPNDEFEVYIMTGLEQ